LSNLAFVLISTEIGFEKEVLATIRKIDNVKNVYPVYGAFDIVAEVESTSRKKLNDIVEENIRHLDKVSSILTMSSKD
jgi:DNA-binding Lrp family transcriptional regulator